MNCILFRTESYGDLKTVYYLLRQWHKEYFAFTLSSKKHFSVCVMNDVPVGVINIATLSYAVVTTMIRLRFDGRSTVYQGTLSKVTLT